MKKYKLLFAYILLLIFYNAKIIAGDITKELEKIDRERNIFFEFAILYSAVDHTLKNDKGYSRELSKLYDKNKLRAINLANFWYTKFRANYEEKMKTFINSYTYTIDKPISEMSKEELDEIKKPLFEKEFEYFRIFIYDNWDKINESIINNLKAEKIFLFKRTFLKYIFKIWWLYIIGVFFIIYFLKIKKIKAILNELRNLRKSIK